MGFLTIKKTKFIKFSFVFLCLTGEAKAFSNLSSSKCPNKFVGTVTAVSVPEASFTSFPKLKIEMDVTSILKGSSANQKIFHIPKNGPVRFIEGQSYEVEMNDRFLCSAKSV